MTIPLLSVAMLGILAPQLPVDAPREDSFKAPEGYRPLGRSLWFDPDGRRLLLRAQVVKREEFLEHLLCLRNTKEHEAILATDATPKLIHAGLILTGAEPGRPVQYRPEFAPPRGPMIAIEAEWTEGGETRAADVRGWVQDRTSGKPLELHWVFAGSMTIDRPGLDEPIYAADGGDLITVANFPEAILDLPVASTADDQSAGLRREHPGHPSARDLRLPLSRADPGSLIRKADRHAFRIQRRAGDSTRAVSDRPSTASGRGLVDRGRSGGGGDRGGRGVDDTGVVLEAVDAPGEPIESGPGLDDDDRRDRRVDGELDQAEGEADRRSGTTGRPGSSTRTCRRSARRPGRPGRRSRPGARRGPPPRRRSPSRPRSSWPSPWAPWMSRARSGPPAPRPARRGRSSRRCCTRIRPA